jgi:PAS domain S-box-containing protein
MVKSLQGSFLQFVRQAPLKTILILPFVIQLVGTVSLVGYFSFRSGQRSVNTLVAQLQVKAGDQVAQHLDGYLAIPKRMNQTTHDAIDLGLLEVTDFDRLEQYLWRQMQRSEVSQLSYATVDGEFLGVERLENGQFVINVVSKTTGLGKLHVYSTNAQGDRTQLLAVKQWNHFSEPWYSQTYAADRPIWSSIFQRTDKINVMSISANHPVRDASGQIIGILNSELLLSKLDRFLDQIDLSSETRTFIIEKNGLIIANCQHQPNYLFRDQAIQRLLASEVDDEFIRFTTRHLVQQFGSLDAITSEAVLRFEINHQRQLTHVSPWKDSLGLDWLVVVVAPEADFMESTYNNTRITVLLCLMALLLAIIIGVLTVRWISLPILQLNKAAKALAQGKWQSIRLKRSDEVGELADSFNQMATQLQASFAKLETLNEALASSKQQLNQILEALPVGVAVVDLNGTVNYVNQTARQMIGVEDPIGTTPVNRAVLYQLYLAGTQKLYPSDRLPSVRALQGEIVTVDDVEIHRDGEVIVLETRTIPVLDSTGEIQFVLTAFQDITAQKQVAEALRQSEAKFRRLAENSPGVIYRYVLHPNGSDEFTYASPGTIDIYGYPPEAIMKNAQLARERIHPEDAESLSHSIQASAEAMRPWQWEGRIISLTGEQKWVKGISRPEREENGDIVWDGVLIDISDRKQSEQLLAEYNITLEKQVHERTIALQQQIEERERIDSELREQQAFLRQIINIIPSSIFVKDRQGCFLCANQAAAAMYGVSVEEMLGKKDADFNANPEQIEGFVANNEQVMSTRQPKHISIEPLVNHQGNLRWYQTIISPLIDVNQQVQGIVGSSTDITELKQVEEELRQAKEAAEAADRAKGAFLANMSHELRTPLNAILGFSQLMSYDATLSAEQQETIDIIYRSGEHLLTLINQVLDLSKIEAGSMTLNEKIFNLYHLLADVRQMFSLKAKQKGLLLDVNCTNCVPRLIHADEVKLRQVLINLMSNAIKFTSTGSVEVRVGYHQRTVLSSNPVDKNLHSTESIVNLLMFEVIDTGIGIEAHELKSLFQPFVQTSSGQKLQEGTGLGLSISYQFIRLMAGELMVYSRGHTFAPDSQELLKKDLFDQSLQKTIFRFAIPVMLPAFNQFELGEAEVKETLTEVEVGKESLNLQSKNTSFILQAVSTENLNLSEFESVDRNWIVQLKKAILEGDLECANHLIDQLKSSHASLAQSLTLLISEYQFDRILEAISKFTS